LIFELNVLWWKPWVIYGEFAESGNTFENYAKLSPDNLFAAEIVSKISKE
jgi:hypothetical protein